MAEHAERDDRDEGATQAMPPVPPRAEERPEPRAKSRDWMRAKDQLVGLLAGIVRWAGLIFAAILVLHVIFVIGEANPDNGIVSFVQNWAEALSLGFENLFTPDDPKLKVLINYGVAALFWLIVSSILARLIRRVGGATI